MLVVADIETERLHNPERIWIIVAKEVESGALHVFRDPLSNPQPFLQFAKTVTGWIGHNFIGFDAPRINRLLGPNVIHMQNVIDTLVVSRLLNTNADGGHSLEAWGNRLGFHKIHFDDFSSFSPLMEEYCIRDVEVNFKLFKKFESYIYSSLWKDALRLEHDVAIICNDMHNNGFHFNIDKAKALYKTVTERLDVLDQELVTAFPPRSVFLREITPRATKHGTIHRQDFRWLESNDLTPYEVGCPFSLFEWEPFNPASPKQIVERLNEAGWQPTEKTKGHIFAERALSMARRTGKAQPTKSGKLLTLREWEEKLAHYETYGWSINEENLSTLPKDAPEPARKLVERLTLANRKSTLEEWFSAFNEATGRIHGSFNHIGAWTHRMSHNSPNVANIPAGESLFAHEMRSMWGVPSDKYLVGVDADGIQLRVLAHYMDDPLFTEALVNGQKENGTDAHSMNQRALGTICRSRDDAKTFIYAWLLGAGTGKIAQILGCSHGEAREAALNFLDAYPNLKFLKERKIPDDASKGYFTGLDGRLVLCQTEHLMLAGYLQNGESVIMKRANVLWRSQLQKERIPFKQVNFVHDEWQTEVPRDLELAKYVAQIQADSIRIVGEQLQLKCPMAGSIIGGNKKLAIGDNWEETH